MTFFAAHFEYVLRLDVDVAATAPDDERLVTLSFALNTGARVIVFIDEIEVYRSPRNLRHIKAHSCSGKDGRGGTGARDDADFYTEKNPITGESRLTSCCSGPDYEYLIDIQHSLDLAAAKDYYVRIEYFHEDSQSDMKYQEEPCLKVFRRSNAVKRSATDNKLILSDTAKVPFGEIAIDETYALTELRDGVFTVTPKIDNMLVDLTKVSVVLEPFTDPNTNVTYAGMDQRTLQVGVEHVFSLGFVDVFSNNLSKLIDMHPPFVITFTDESGGANYQATEHYLNELTKRNEFKLNISTTVLNTTCCTNSAYLSVLLFGQHVAKSPFKHWSVLPGAFSFTKSVIFENNLKSTYYTNTIFPPEKRRRCYVGEVCTQQFDLVDNFCNYLNLDRGIIRSDMTNLNILGPYNNYDNRPPGYTYVRNVTQYDAARPEYYFTNYFLNYTGEWRLRIRVKSPRGTAPAYTDPVLVQVYSDRLSRLFSLASTAHYYVGEATVTLTAKDKFDNTLTDQFETPGPAAEGQTFITHVNYTRYGDNPVPEWDRNSTKEYLHLDYNYSIVGDNSTY